MLLVQSVTFENSGLYSCYASNTLGEAVESKEIIIKGLLFIFIYVFFIIQRSKENKIIMIIKKKHYIKRNQCCLLSGINIFLDQPYPPTINSLRAFSADAIQISWNESFDGHSPIIQYIIEYTADNQSWNIILVHSNNFSANALQMKPYTTYYFRLKAKNVIGESTYSQIAKVKTLEGGSF